MCSYFKSEFAYFSLKIREVVGLNLMWFYATKNGPYDFLIKNTEFDLTWYRAKLNRRCLKNNLFRTEGAKIHHQNIHNVGKGKWNERRSYIGRYYHTFLLFITVLTLSFVVSRAEFVCYCYTYRSLIEAKIVILCLSYSKNYFGLRLKYTILNTL